MFVYNCYDVSDYRPFQRGLGLRETFLEDGGYEGILSAMLNWSRSRRSCGQNMEFNFTYMVHIRPERLAAYLQPFRKVELRPRPL